MSRQLARAGAAILALVCLPLVDCKSRQPSAAPSIQFTRLPVAGQGSPEILNLIEGRVTGARRGQRIVLFARSGVWWVQPLAAHATAIQSDFKWSNSTHPGTAYAALLVDPAYVPPLRANELPQAVGLVRAIAVAEGAALGRQAPKVVHFCGYDWEVRETPGSPGGSLNLYDSANVWVDPAGRLHLRIAKDARGWKSAEVDLPRSLGFGSYRFVLGDVAHLDRTVVFAISTWDDSGPYREMDLEVSRWGETSGKNAQYVIQPYYIPANVVRFLAPSGPLEHSLVWEPGRVSFKTVHQSEVIASHVFTSGIPLPGSESLRLNLYVFNNQRTPLQHGDEVIIEKFEYLP